MHLEDLYCDFSGNLLNGFTGLRYHSDWRSETQTAVSLLAFSHWLETGSLLTQPETENKLGCEFFSSRYFSVNVPPLGFIFKDSAIFFSC